MLVVARLLLWLMLTLLAWPFYVVAIGLGLLAFEALPRFFKEQDEQEGVE